LSRPGGISASLQHAEGVVMGFLYLIDGGAFVDVGEAGVA